MFVNFACVVVTRALFVFVAFIGVWRVTYVKNNNFYWFLTFLYLPLVVELILTLSTRKGKDYKWFSPAILFFLVSIVPTLWILELDYQENSVQYSKCNRPDLSQSIRSVLEGWNNVTNGTENQQEALKVLSMVCSDDWIMALQQILMILLIVGKWLIPVAGGVSRDEMSQLMLIFIGTGGDTLDFVSSLLPDIAQANQYFNYIILTVWTWSMLQFPLHVSVLSSKTEDSAEGQSRSFFSRHQADIWCIVETFVFQDGPFFVVRLTVMIMFSVYDQMMVFYIIKNVMVLMLNVYRLWILFTDDE